MFKSLSRRFEENKQLNALAVSLGAGYSDTRNHSIHIADLMRFKMRAMARAFILPRIQKLAADAYTRGATSDESIAHMYDVEYSNTTEPNYMYLNSLMSLKGFELITGYKASELPNMQILDVGAGSNELLRFINKKLSVGAEQLYGSDISPASRDIIERDGFHGYAGRIESLALPSGSFDIVFLSYFIDFDTDQKTTFETAAKLTRPGGKIILEGLFPSQPSGLLPEDQRKNIFITKGDGAVEDINLVCEAFIKIGSEQNKQIRIERIIRSRRYVYSRYGFKKLPSYYIVARVN